jgi:signal transduction histidine kinase
MQAALADRRHTVLVVDDEEAVVESVHDLLRRDYRVLCATSAAQGLELLDHEEAHVVMSDQRMPGMTGVEFLHRAHRVHPDAIRLLFTGYADIRAVIDAINRGNVYRYITKPWDPDELQATIRDAASRYDLVAERNRLVAELTRSNAELERKNRELEETSALKTSFIRVASHELRSPLVVLGGMTELALREELPEPAQSYLRRIEGAAGRLRRSVEQITTMLSLGNLRPSIARRPVVVAGLLGDAADAVQPFVARRRQHLEVDDQGVGTAVIDPDRTRDCIDHLLLNAIKFTPDGGTIRLSARRGGGRAVELIVRDDGVGIDQACLRRIFEPFFTGFDSLYHSSGTFEFGKKGLGLGLAVVRAFAELQGGRVEVESRVGEGSTFTVTIPDHAGDG